jgi:hypothetical protein|tara:strand:- start:4 stop:360 length:357 start_codon:yes stop_codon:yes gene_type:complete
VKPINLNLFEDTEPHKLHRKNDPLTSIESAYAVPSGKMRQLVLDQILEAGEKGITIKEMVFNNQNIPTSSITSRPNELEKLNLIFYRGDKRNHARVIRHIKYKLLETIQQGEIRSEAY